MAEIVWFGHAPDTAMFVPPTMLGVAVPEPPLATGKTPVAWLTGTTVALVKLMAVGVPKLAAVNKSLTVICLVVVD
jgi:hypothetical protein